MVTRQNFALLLLGMTLGLAAWTVNAAPAGGSLTSWQKGYIEGLLAGQAFFSPGSIKVSVDGTTAELQGQVSSRQARALAEQLALSTRGIRSVVNRLRVSSPAVTASLEAESSRQNKLSNVTINNKVMSRLLAHTETRGLDIEVKTVNRNVFVTGLVPSTLEKELVYWLIKNTEGVVEVVDNLQLAEDLPQQAGI